MPRSCILKTKKGVTKLDTFVEQIIMRKKTPAQVVCAVLLMALCALLLGFLLVFVTSLFFILLLPIGAGMWWLLSGMNIEYEYCITNGDIDIDRIVARRKRERVVSVALGKLESAGRYDPQKWQGRQVDRLVMAAPSEKEDGLYCFSYRSKKRGHTLVIFQPNERVHESFGKALPRLLQSEWEK